MHPVLKIHKKTRFNRAEIDLAMEEQDEEKEASIEGTDLYLLCMWVSACHGNPTVQPVKGIKIQVAQAEVCSLNSTTSRLSSSGSVMIIIIAHSLSYSFTPNYVGTVLDLVR